MKQLCSCVKSHLKIFNALDLKTLQLFDVAAIAVVGCPKLLQLLLKPIHCGDCGARNQKLPLAQLLTTQNRGVGLNLDPHEESNS